MSRSGTILAALGRGAELVAQLGWALAIMALPVFVVVTGVLVSVIWNSRGRRAQGDRTRQVALDPAARQASVSEGRAERPILVLGAVIPALVVAAALAASVITLQRLPSGSQEGSTEPNRDTVVIDIVGSQWWWSVAYPQHGVVTANEVHLPVGQPVLLRLTSTDVIHSFWVPRLGGKTDALPDDTNLLTLHAEEPGRYPGVCAEFCGLNHARMRMVAVAHEPAGFAQWLSQQQGTAADPTKPQETEGRGLFLSAGCAACHTIRSGTGPLGSDSATARRRGPDLTHLASRERIVGGSLDNTREELRRWITDPAQLKEETIMPPATLPDEQLEALLSYLESLQ